MWVNILCFGRAFLLRCVPSVFLELSLSTANLRIFYKLAAQGSRAPLLHAARATVESEKSKCESEVLACENKFLPERKSPLLSSARFS